MEVAVIIALIFLNGLLATIELQNEIDILYQSVEKTV